MKWKFSPDGEDGAIWLQNPELMHVYIIYTNDGRHWRRLMVATLGWLQSHLAKVSKVDKQGWAVVPTVLVLPNATGDELRILLDQALNQGGLDSYSTAA